MYGKMWAQSCNSKHGFSNKIGLCVLVVLTIQMQAVVNCVANAEEVKSVSTFVSATEDDRKYYIEFRSRIAGFYSGHTFAMFGKLSEERKIVTREYAGLHPTHNPNFNSLILGHFVWVPAFTGPADDDKIDEYVTSRVRILLTNEEYDRVRRFIKNLQRKSHHWHGLLYNCNDFVGQIGQFMGLIVPINGVMFPEAYINEIRERNSKNEIHKQSIGEWQRIGKRPLMRKMLTAHRL